MKRKLKKPAFPSKKITLVTVEEKEPEPAKKGDSGDEDTDDQQDDDERTEFNDEPTKTDNPKISEEYERINGELYGDVNVNLTDAEPADKEKYDAEMTVAGHANANQEGANNQKTTLFETMTISKSFNKSPKQRALYHALMESILKDEDAMDEGVADELKKSELDDADKDEGPSIGSD
nr:hypothetical protein [Tanacetum cinerariifolium]